MATLSSKRNPDPIPPTSKNSKAVSAPLHQLDPDVLRSPEVSDLDPGTEGAGFLGELGSQALQPGGGFLQVGNQEPEVIQAQARTGRAGWQILVRRDPQDKNGQTVDIQVDPGLPVGLDRLEDLRPEHAMVILGRGPGIPAEKMDVVKSKIGHRFLLQLLLSVWYPPNQLPPKICFSLFPVKKNGFIRISFSVRVEETELFEN
jgi:hypothetical protein